MAKIVHVDIGDRLTPQATFTVGGSPTDPTQIVVKQQDPAGIETTVTTASSPGTLTTSSTPLARISAGVFKLSPGVSASLSGHWFFRFEATGTAESAEDFQYDVDPSEFFTDSGVNSRALVSLPDAKDWLQVANVDTTNDLELVRVINDVSDRFYEEADGREFKRFDSTSSPTIRMFDVGIEAQTYMPFRIGDLSTTPTLVRILDKDGTARAAVATADMVLYPRNRKPWQPITQIQFTTDVICPYWTDSIEITGVWGFPSVPGGVRQAVLDAVVATIDRPVESYSQDLAPAQTGAATNVIVAAGRPQFLVFPPPVLAEAWKWRDPLAA